MLQSCMDLNEIIYLLDDALAQADVNRILAIVENIRDAYDAGTVFYWAANNGHADLVELLLPKVDPYNIHNTALRSAAVNGHFDVVKLLLVKSSMLSASGFNIAFCAAVESGHAKVVKLMLTDPRFDPSAEPNLPVKWVAKHGNTDIIKLLLTHPRVNPAATQNRPIIKAAKHGHAAVVNLLMADPRVDPTVFDNYPFRLAFAKNHLDVINVLLDHSAVLAYVHKNLHLFSNNQAVLTLIWKKFFDKMPYYIATLHANGFPNDLIVNHIAPKLNPFFQYYANCINEKNKVKPISCDSLYIIKESNKILPRYEQNAMKVIDSKEGTSANKLKISDSDIINDNDQTARKKRRTSYFGFTEWF